MLHALILEAKLRAERYRLRKDRAGHWNVYRFADWRHDPKGYALVDRVRTEAEAHDVIFERTGTANTKAVREPLPIVPFTVYSAPDDWGYA